MVNKFNRKRHKRNDGGYIEISRERYRFIHGEDSLVDKTEAQNIRSCIQDSLWHLSYTTLLRERHLTLKKLYETMPTQGNTNFADVDLMLRRKGYCIDNVSKYYCMAAGGAEYSVLKEKNKLLLLKLVVTSKAGDRYDKTPHFCAYNGNQIIDNFIDCPIVIVENSDRENCSAAKSVFRNLYRGYKSVQIHTVYELIRIW